MGAFLTIISYCALLFLIMPPTGIGILGTFVLLVLGPVLLVWKKPWEQRCPFSRLGILTAVIFSVYLGQRFHIRWTAADIFPLVASALPVPEAVCCALINIAAVCGPVCAVYFCIGIFEQAKKLIFISDKAQSLKRNLWCSIIAASITVMSSQIMLGIDIVSMGHFKFLCGTLIVSSLSLILYCLLGNLTVSIALGSGLFMVISTVNVYVFEFRGRLFDPVDIMSAGVALNVLENYDILSSLPIILLGWGIWAGLLFCIARSCTKNQDAVTRTQRAVLSACCAVLAALLFVYASNLQPFRWTNQGATNHGYILNYVSRIKEISVKQPSGYDPEHIEALAEQYLPEKDTSGEGLQPHIIVIMDEAFSDLNVFSQLQTDAEVTPFISNLRHNTISGYALASAYGGNTANSEYEFLTGNSMAWLLPNSVPYQQYVNAPVYSMVSYLKSNYNYHCVAMHPFGSEGWNRSTVYPLMGFDECFFVEDFPGKHLFRSYISDAEMFQKIMDTYETRGDDPLFLFGVTMQNHGGYVEDDHNLERISPVGYSQEYPDVSRYLSLIHETDKAVERLISYFENADDDVVIAFFGDHQPKIDEAFYREISGNSFSTLDDRQKQYLVPFFVWANYDIDETYLEEISLSYLSSYVYEAAGIPLPPYNQFLSEMEKAIPAINANGFYSLNSNCYLPFDMASGDEKQWLDLYEHLQYNNVFDKKLHNNILFPVLE